jgi:alkanesulfonate monooxygenase SsuD/methylene tetrahydromethanopterin reductase-like flavin-dependent oxidoreductase (luciferase family)
LNSSFVEARSATIDRPFADGSVCVAVYPHDLPASDIIDDLVGQAVLAEELGFDGVTLAEHHGLPGYVPNPVQAAEWILAATTRIWAGPCPLILPIRSPGLVAEEVAWLAVRFPGRVVVGFAPGYAHGDFEIAAASRQDRSKRFREALPILVGALSGRAAAPLAGDPAIAATLGRPLVVVSTAAGPVLARNAARCGAGLILGPYNPVPKCRAIFDAYLEEGGPGPRILIRRPWVGSDATARMENLATHYKSIGADDSWMSERMSSELVFSSDGKEIAERLQSAIHEANASCLRVMFNLPGTTPQEVREQLCRFGEEVLPHLRRSGELVT